MSLEYSITYTAENTYEDWVNDAHWQFLIIPQKNDNQEFIDVQFNNSLNTINEFSVNGYGFQTIRVHPKKKFRQISFEAHFKLIKREVNPFDFLEEEDISQAYAAIQQLDFKVDFEAFLRNTRFTTLPEKNRDAFVFNKNISLFENLQGLNEWTYTHIYFKTDVTDVNTALDEVIEKRHGVCQDFAHLFCALARQNGIPTRYVSGYLHQGNGFFGDSQMHAWAEAYIPKIGWIGFDPTNNLLANTNHIKIAHGKDYTDCSPLKGVVYTTGRNETSHTVQVSSQQQ
ncbi:transglutaminase family protein [Pricia sp.]|uniref:transglutaminase-like domain-containing protein n=1 Tax=Pricia sp. TaxID=2268138 RepID=UPI0035941C13